MKYFLNILFNVISLCIPYQLSDLKYTTDNIEFKIMKCPQYIDCTSLVFNAMSECNLPGSYRNFIWEFSDNPFEETEHNGINNIVFKYMPEYTGITRFSIDEFTNEIIEVDVIIDPIGLDELNIYNILLHELGHVMLLKHSDNYDSIMSYAVYVDSYNNPIPIYEKKYITRDDCYGIYMKLITDIINYDYIYAVKLNNMMIKFCNEISENIVYNLPQKRNIEYEDNSYIKIINTSDYYDIIYL